jgi:hypothetical protein
MTPAACRCTRTTRPSDHDLLHDEITTIDDALTRPWTVTKNYRRERNVVWVENVCNEYNSHVAIQPLRCAVECRFLALFARRRQWMCRQLWGYTCRPGRANVAGFSGPLTCPHSE